MSHAAAAAAVHATLDDWIARDAIPFPMDSPDGFDAAVDRMMAALGGSVELLGFGEALHGGEDILVFRNRLFRRLVEAHGYTAIAVESSFPRGRAVNAYVAGRGAAGESYEGVREVGFSHGMGQLEANRELVEWMREHNGRGRENIRFYGFDSPTEMMNTDSPRQLLHLALDYLTSIDPASGLPRRERIDRLLGDDAAWENPAAMMDPSKSIGGSAAANALRLETEELISELRLRGPELVARSDGGAHLDAVQRATGARHLLNYHASLARASDKRLVELLGIRDLTMADNLAYAVARERGRGKVLAFAHNSHLQRGQAFWQWGPNALAWWPAGAHVSATLGPRYAVIGSAVGVSAENGIAEPEAGSLEARLVASPGPVRFIPTHGGRAVPPEAVAGLRVRTGSARNPGYFPLAARSFADVDGLVAFDSTTYNRGGRPLPP